MTKRIMIAATGSGSGKTTVTCALLKCLQDRGLNPHSFKCGPDYIDPLFHRMVLGIPSGNLDTFFSTKEEVRAIFGGELEQAGIAVVEGVMGLYDGLGGIRQEGSSYHLAECLEMPIILVVDGHGMGRSILPLIAGFLQYDRKKLIKGVLLNHVSKSFYDTIAPLIARELGIRPLGCMPKDEKLTVPGRHLGLYIPSELKNLQEQITYAGQCLEKYADIEGILAIAEDAEITEAAETTETAEVVVTAVSATSAPEEKKTPVRIGIARDEAFCFYYRENLRMLEELGAELVDFSPLHDEGLPENLQGIYLGGGYPELYAEQLSRNHSMRAAILQAVKEEMVIVAECGGFMYLHEELQTMEGQCFPMVGAIAGRCSYTGKLVRFGYIELRCRQDCEKIGFLEKGTLAKGHEFHYFDSTRNGEDCVATKPVTGKSYSCVQMGKNYFWGFPHLYYPSAGRFAEYFVEQCRNRACILKEKKL